MPSGGHGGGSKAVENSEGQEVGFADGASVDLTRTPSSALVITLPSPPSLSPT